jgi:hypothetical protein
MKRIYVSEYGISLERIYISKSEISLVFDNVFLLF